MIHRPFPRALAAVLLLAGGSLTGARAVPVAAAEPVKIGVLTEAWGPNPQAIGMKDGLKALGYREDEHFVIGVRFTQGDPEALYAAARDLVQQRVDILFTGGGVAAKAAQAATSRIPIVFAGGGDDPIERELIQSYARPGGNITGVIDLGPELAPKRLEIFREVLPGLKRVLLVYAAKTPYGAESVRAYREAARHLGIVLVEKPVRDRKEAQAAFARIHKGEVQGILVSHSLAWNVPGLALEATARPGIPSMFPSSFYVQEGGLAAYGPDYYATGRQAARLVDKIIKGTKPGDIPVESNPRIEFAINLKVARKLGVQIPPRVVTRADRVVQ